MDSTNRKIAIAGTAAIVIFVAFIIGFTVLDQETQGKTTVLEPMSIEIDVPDLGGDWIEGVWNQRVGSNIQHNVGGEDYIELSLSLQIPATEGSFRYMKIEYTIPSETKLMINEWYNNGDMESYVQCVDPLDRNNWMVTYSLDRGDRLEDFAHNIRGYVMWRDNIDSNDLFLMTCTLGVAKNGVINEYVQHFEYHLNKIEDSDQ